MNFKDLEIKGKVCKEVSKGYYCGSEAIIFVVDNTEKYALVHFQDCCEEVFIESVDGDLEDLVGAELLMAEEAYCRVEDNEIESHYDYSQTWSYYKFATYKGYVTIRFFGASNGYYSEEAMLYRIPC